MSSEFFVVIPARYASERLPGKVLLPLAGLPMVVHVARAAQASGAAAVIVAADDARTVAACGEHSIDAVLTDPDHQSGTDRVNEVARSRGWSPDAIVVNVQGDEPLMPPQLIKRCAQALANDASADIATPCHAITEVADYLSPHAVKVVQDLRGYALYFSRACIPADRSTLLAGEQTLPQAGAMRHIGLYAYRVSALAKLSALPPAALERSESLEQLRALANGLRIRMVEADTAPGPGVDTAADIAKVEALMAQAAPATP